MAGEVDSSDKAVYVAHYSVLNKRIMEIFKESLSETEEHLFLDMTFGAGGHSFSLLRNFSQSKVIAFDQDQEALENGKKIIDEKNLNISLIHDNFENFREHIGEVKFSGIIADLGVSTHHLLDGDRGFSFKQAAPLDMRMNQDSYLTAEKVVNEYNENQLVDIFEKYGEDRYSKRIASKIIEQRKKNKLKTTKDLENIIFHCYPKKSRYGKLNPSTKIFQAIRIEVNNELGVLENVLEDLPNFLTPGGLLAIISFHSLEDRIVKHSFKKFSPVIKGPKEFSLYSKKPILPDQAELDENPRSRSAKLRVLIKNP